MARDRAIGPRADFFMALIAGITISVIFCWLPFVGPFVAGLLAGIIIDGHALNGVKVGLLSALFAAPPISFIFELMVGSHLGILSYLALIGLPFLIGGGLLAEVVGGAIGGHMRRDTEVQGPKSNPTDTTRHP